MPQLDFYSIANQLVFGSLSFIFFYLIIELYVVPTLFTSIFARDYYLKNSRNNVNTLFYYSFFAFYIFSRLVDETYAIVSSSENNLNYLASIDKRIFSKNFQKDDFADILKVMHEDSIRFGEFDSSKFEMEPIEAVSFYDIKTSDINKKENTVTIDGKPFHFKFLFTDIEDKVPSIELLNTPGDRSNITHFDLQEFQKLMLDKQMEGGLKRENSSDEDDELGFDLEPRPSEFSEQAEDYARGFLVSYLKDRHDTYANIYSRSKTVDEVEEYRELMEEEEDEGEEEGQEEEGEEDDDDYVEKIFPDDEYDAPKPDVGLVYEDYIDLVHFLREKELHLAFFFNTKIILKLIKMIFHIGNGSNFNFSQFLKSFNEKATAIIRAFASSINNLSVFVLGSFVAFMPYVYSVYLRFISRVSGYRYIDTVSFFSSFFGRRILNLYGIGAAFNTFDVIFFSVALHIFYSPTFLGSSHIYLSNESIWIVCLLTIIVFSVKYYKLYMGDQKLSLEIQIDEIKAVCLSNASLAAQVNELQHSILEEQRELLVAYYNLLLTLEEDTFQPNRYREGFLRNRAFELTEACYEDTKDYILKLGLLVVQIEDLILLSELNETSEEIISQFIDERNS